MLSMSIGQLFASARIVTLIAIFLLIVAMFVSVASAQSQSLTADVNRSAIAVIPGQMVSLVVVPKGNLGSSYVQGYWLPRGVSLFSATRVLVGENEVHQVSFFVSKTMALGSNDVTLQVFDDAGQVFRTTIKVVVGETFPKSIDRLARHFTSAIAVYAASTQGTTQAVANFRTLEGVKVVADYYKEFLENPDDPWVIAPETEVRDTSAYLNASKAGMTLQVTLKDEPINHETIVVMTIEYK